MANATQGGGDPDDLRVPAIGGPGRASGPDAADAVDGAEGSRGAAAVVGVAETGRAGGAEAIASALSTGAIDAAEAKAQLIDEAVRAQLPEGTDPAVIAAVRAEVEALLAGDPVLDDLLAR